MKYNLYTVTKAMRQNKIELWDVYKGIQYI